MVAPGLLLKINPTAHLETDTVAGQRLRVLDRGAADRPSLTLGDLEDRTGFFSPGPGTVAIAVDGVEVKRWDGPEAAADDVLSWLSL